VRRTRGTPLAPPLVQASTFFAPGDPKESDFVYTRYGNPTFSALEMEQQAMCGAPSLSYPSGMAASAAIMDALVPRDAVVVMASDCYYNVRTLARTRAFRCRWVESTKPHGFAEAAAGAAMVWIETPTNPGLRIVDIEETARACKAAGALLVVDNTLATAVGQEPLALGADIALISATKMTSGHHDATIGLVSARDAAIATRLREHRTMTGMIAGVLEAWLCLRGMKTLALRSSRCSETALFLAHELSAYDARYPGLPTHPSHELASRQMKHFGPVLTFDLVSQDRAVAFCSRLIGIAESTSFGGVDTTLERRARWGGDEVSPGLIRMSVGLEDPERLLDELRRALADL
jgi:cystathionine gamma-lyase